MTITILIVLLAMAVGPRVWERVQLDRNREKIPIRIHVNGTRGKSSVTRLIAGALRGGGLKTLAKTTGTLPRLIREDGTEVPIHRLNRANIREQFHILRLVAAREPDAIIIECMALQPLLQDLSERRIVQATIGVITNSRADHLDVMGPGVSDVARALCGTVPPNGTMVTAERDELPVFEDACAHRNAKLVAVSADDVAAVPDEVMTRFGYYEHRENVALALEVARLCGVSDEAAFEGMLHAPPDPGALSMYEVDFFGRQMVFVHGFAANDPESSETIWNLACNAFPDIRRRIIVLNLRADRADRSRQLGEAVVAWRRPDRLVLMGNGVQIGARAAVKGGYDPMSIVFAEDEGAPAVFERILDLVEERTLVVGLGNVAGAGLDLVRHFRNRGSKVSLAVLHATSTARADEGADKEEATS